MTLRANALRQVQDPRALRLKERPQTIERWTEAATARRFGPRNQGTYELWKRTGTER